MENTRIASQIYAKFAFEPTVGQKKVVELLSDYISRPADGTIFILNGYAGTGKTTLVSAFVGALKGIGIKPILLAPTGRAAKVFSHISGEKAFTIHKKIYRQKSLSAESSFTLDFNTEKNACFIVDEASMLANSTGDGQLFGSGALLDDLITYVNKGQNCRLVLVGDNAQLPPVGSDRSPALDARAMSVYGDVVYASMDDVVRQGAESGILFNATLVRMMIENNITEIPLFRTTFPEIGVLDGSNFTEKLEECYSRYGRDETIVVTRSNKRANRFNDSIRRFVLGAEGEIESGDMLMVVKNNYHFAERDPDSPMNFIANGDIARLRRLRRFEELYGFRFADAVLEFPDYDGYQAECKILLDTIYSESPSLTREESNRLFYAVEGDYADIGDKRKRYKEIRANDHFNAIQVKFAYAITGHKAQGGQWSAVFIDKMLFGDEAMSRDLLRWLYTTVTRATDRLYFVNFDDRFFETANYE
ncbi:MAG: AAA family ATPase [Rikenellaceae bacterium]|jgi:exodeoxyribonuclease-5|nr:AAA family ATPase [Rikenellaceae bacterium]